MNREEGASAICNNNQIVLTLKMGTINAQHTAAVTSAMRRAAVATPRSRYRRTARRPRRTRRRRRAAAPPRRRSYCCKKFSQVDFLLLAY